MCELYNFHTLVSRTVSIPYAISLFLLTAALAGGQASPSAPTVSPAAKTPSSDAEVEQAIQKRFAKSKIAVNSFEVRVHDGVAILEGRTDVIQHKGTATRLARTAGARRVDNRIRISERAKRKASGKQRSRPRRVHVRRGDPRG